MTVVSRLMYGSMYVKSYDWCSEDDPEATTEFARPAKLVQESVISGPAGTLVLYPKEGNIHSFTALTPCAVLDVLGPPYAPSNGRDCTYYKEQPCPVQAANGKGFTVGLQEFEPPDDFVVERGNNSPVFWDVSVQLSRAWLRVALPIPSTDNALSILHQAGRYTGEKKCDA
eukprot:scaffold856_cov326-Pavlova_lutheri.AAC.8